MGKILVKVHKSYRMVVAVCDEGVFGRKLVSPTRDDSGEPDGKRVLDVSGEFFRGESLNLDEARDKVEWCVGEDATFNFVGAESVGLAKELGLVRDEGVIDIDGVPVALVLL